jgi:hypothetical protein
MARPTLLSALFEPIVEISLRCVVTTGDKLLGGTICQQALDLGTIWVEFAFPRSGRSSEYHSLRLLEAQRLLSALRNQVAFYLRSHPLLGELVRLRLGDSRICSDKTGTLTRNEMTVRHLVTRVGQYDLEGIGYASEGRVSRDGQEASLSTRPNLQALVEVMAVCNDSEIAQENGQWVEEFSPIQVAPQSDGPPDRRQ